jgi:hypothetical protein
MNDPREMIDAFTASANAAASGMKKINTELMDFGKTRFETETSAAEAIFAAKSMKDMMALQRDFMVSTMEAYTQEATKLSELTTEVTSEVMGHLPKPVSL